MLRFAIKAGIAATAVHYVNKEGVWKESQESLKAYDRLNATLEPYLKQLLQQIPFELPAIPQTERTSHTTQLYWNKGVTSTFEFLRELPGLVSKWTSQGITAVLENPQVQQLLDNKVPESGDATPVLSK